MNNERQYYGTTPILESEPIEIPNAKQCRVNHGLVTAIPFEDITLGVWKNREIKKVILENKQKWKLKKF